MDLKASSKEQALSSNNMTEEQQEMEALKLRISELNLQRENDLEKIQVILHHVELSLTFSRNLTNKSLSSQVHNS